jgi:type II secretory pathway predicted ATPase ExeA
MSWLKHWGLMRDPFSKELLDGELWVPSSKQAVVDSLVSAVSERNSALLVGDAGVGKTCILRALRHRLDESAFRLTYCHNSTLGRRDFYRQLCVALGLSPKATAAAVFHDVSTHVQELGKERVHPVFLIDEAHLLHQDVLDHLHILLNYAWDSRALLSLVLVGLPDLWEQLELRRNRSLYSRLSARLAVSSTSSADTAEYLSHRLSLAGGPVDAFDPHAIMLLHESSGGALRDLDRVARNALKVAARRELRKVTDKIVQAAFDAEIAHRRGEAP